jgi:hypothetical protein
MSRQIKNNVVIDDSNYLRLSYPVVFSPSNTRQTIMGMAKPSPKHSGNQVLIDLGVAIRNVRLGSGLSQESLAVDAGLDRSYVGALSAVNTI